jgi:hypothetical protein
MAEMVGVKVKKKNGAGGMFQEKAVWTGTVMGKIACELGLKDKARRLGGGGVRKEEGER